MTDTMIHKTMFLKATREEVWAYLTQPEKLATWFHAPKVPLTTGTKLEMFGTESGNLLIWGDVIVARPPEYLEYTFTIKPMGDASSTVAWTLTAVPGGTHLDLTHVGLPQGAEDFGLTFMLDGGWEEHIARMRADLATTADAAQSAA